jgi:hypothetical protein
MSRLSDQSGWQSLASSLNAGVMLAGNCTVCQPPRRIEIQIAALIERYGPHVMICDVADRFTCAACGAWVQLSLVPIDTGPGR